MIRATPKARIDAACALLGTEEVIARCVALLDGGRGDISLLVMLGGAHARRLVASGIPDDQAYWLRVHAARGLLWAGVTGATDALRRSLGDESWRVREMACKVIARHRVGDLIDDVALLDADPVRRVRVAAARAVARIVEAGA